MLTKKLFYDDSHIFEFEANVIDCQNNIVELDRTAFFPGGGGQQCDLGTIGDVRVIDVFEKDGTIYHKVEGSCEGKVNCKIDKETRLRRMQNHSGEHIVSGLVYKQFGYDNVGFHMSDGFMTIDFNGELSWEQVLEIEKTANEVIRANIKVTASFPNNVSEIEYRSKLDLTDNIRIVEIEGVDICACCAPHVNYTGEVGIIKMISCERHRGGVRINLTCGIDALDMINLMQNNITDISEALSSPREKTAEAVKHLIGERDKIKSQKIEIENKLIRYIDDTQCCVFENLGEAAQRELCNRLMEKHKVAGVFSNGKYVIGSKTEDLKTLASAINDAIDGRGGGKKEMIMGSYSASDAKLKELLNDLNKA